jgi:hypothetical protein
MKLRFIMRYPPHLPHTSIVPYHGRFQRLAILIIGITLCCWRERVSFHTMAVKSSPPLPGQPASISFSVRYFQDLQFTVAVCNRQITGDETVGHVQFESHIFKSLRWVLVNIYLPSRESHDSYFCLNAEACYTEASISYDQRACNFLAKPFVSSVYEYIVHHNDIKCWRAGGL